MQKETIVKAKQGLAGTVEIPGDKSISHRAVLFASLADGVTTIKGFLEGEDCLSTIACMRKLGVVIEQNGTDVTVTGKGLQGLREPDDVLDTGNSGTTIRLLMGVLAGLPFSSVLKGDASIAKRPMARVTGPLKMMNARIDGRQFGDLTPIHIRGGELRGITYYSPVASAQVKSAVLLAGLQAQGVTTVNEPHKSRDHTERMLRSFGVEVETDDDSARIMGGQTLDPAHIEVPGDISSAAFMLTAALIVPGSKVKLFNTGLNPTRDGIMEVLEMMGANITRENERLAGDEPVADLTVKTSELKGVTIGGGLIPRLIDEIPAIAVLATQAHGTTVIKDAEELKVKETNRIDTVVNQLKKLGADIEAKDDGMVIRGPISLTGGNADSFGDHRIGMAMALCGLISEEPVTVSGTEAIAVSYPGFFDQLNRLKGSS
ncbi:3-phosphoshikimate 1-carboxyvinyltransferase [Salisediminibacterium selenitireducens]|uniref:3-phosphoshikimate 1-carboxyvinyltransferase n=1 Tax=Bacillus selenitireducens (strain ATCC 700615 / DSM 15326 / MLS10) TaxID=439292 RepID=D6XUY7_BACIE|nr:3-phosphoshikimate 1-carboxyvinyltransferase [Salisediminibacterium selenitireducens]ADH99623.1 3-phosphoshikimate 1-carboxyvinyltransferase [[Bacillus] selenitireducens MLS10]